eukprot:517159-Rhodomonas_salina.1
MALLCPGTERAYGPISADAIYHEYFELRATLPRALGRYRSSYAVAGASHTVAPTTTSSAMRTRTFYRISSPTNMRYDLERPLTTALSIRYEHRILTLPMHVRTEHGTR